MSDTENFTRGQRIITKDETADRAYLILSGSVKVFLEDGSKVVELATLGENEIFGESALFSGEPYGANIDAAEDTTLQIITPDSFATMMEGTDPIIQTLLNMLVKRLKSTNEALMKSETREFMDIDLI